MGEGWEAPLERVAAQAAERVAAVRRAQEQVRQVRVSAAAVDGLVTVVVAAQGQLVALRLGTAVYDRVPEGQLAGVIMGLVRAAAADAALRVREIVAPLLPEDLLGGRGRPGCPPGTGGVG